MQLNGIDISSWQGDLVPAQMATTDFVIVKATGGIGYINPKFNEHADATIAAGKLLGCYHYARERGCAGSAKAEADFFIGAFKPYAGKAIPFLDWEADALSLGPAWALTWLDRVKAKTGVAPGVYMSKSTCRAADWSAVAKKYPLWVAQYPDYEETGYQKSPWTDGNGYGAWEKPLLFQYTSSGKVAGYSGRLDLNVFYGSRADWEKRCKKAESKKKAANKREAAKPMTIDRARIAVQIMTHLCECPAHGYSQPGRYGTSGYCDVETDAGVIQVKRGDRDCSSAVCEAWELALRGTEFDGRITRENWTGGMREMFVGSGLFTWEPTSFFASPGDIYLNESDHTAMCIQNDEYIDLLGEFSISETGGIDGEPGDQTGNESNIHGFYENWDGILHYVGGSIEGDTPAVAPSSGGSSDYDLPMPRFRVAIMRGGKKAWLPWMRGMVDEGGSDDAFAGIPGCGIVDVEFEGGSLGPGGWFTKQMKGNKLIGLTVFYDTPNPGVTGYYEALYRVHWLSNPPAWGKYEHDDDDGGAGDDVHQLDMIELTISRV